MITMDVKGLTWVGNVYDKFEAMCLEVEEIMYQDTIKYVENQVQTVGASVKKFYSEVMHDLLPPSSAEDVRLAAYDFHAEKYDHVGNCREAKGSMKQDPIRSDAEQVSDDSKVITDTHQNKGYASKLHRRRNINNLFPKSSGDSAKGALSYSASRKNNDEYMYFKSNLNIKEINGDCMHPEEKSGTLTPLEKDLGRTSSFRRLSDTLKDQAVIASSHASVKVANSDVREESSNEVENANEKKPDVPSDDPLSLVSNIVESSGNKETEKRMAVCEGLHKEPDAAEICARDMEVSHVGSSEHGSGECEKSSDGVFVPYPERLDGWHLDAVAAETVTEQETETSQYEEDFEECVVVDGQELYFVPLKEGKQKPYKKRIKDAFSSRKILARKQEYQQLASCYGNVKLNQNGASNLMPTLTLEEPKKPLTDDSCESEWELL